MNGSVLAGVQNGISLSNEWVSVGGCAERPLSLMNESVLADVQNGFYVSLMNGSQCWQVCMSVSLSL